MAKKSFVNTNKIGSWSFLIGLVLAVLLGLGYTGSYGDVMLWAVFLIGVVVGILNIAVSEVSRFLNSGTVLVLVSYLAIEVGVFHGVAPQIVGVLSSILTLFVPATIIVALRAVFGLARD